jgi:hypothetical protein
MASTYLRSSNPKFIKTLQRKDLIGAWPRQTYTVNEALQLKLPGPAHKIRLSGYELRYANGQRKVPEKLA